MNFARALGVTVVVSWTLLGVLRANAALTIVEPDAFASGTDISSAYSGVTLSALGQSVSPSVRSLTSSFASTGTRVFGNTDDGHEWGDGFNGGMRAVFAAPTDFVSVDIIGNDSYDSGRLLAYNSASVLLATYTTGILGSGTIEAASVTRLAGDIAYVIATGSASGADSVSLDRLTFNDSAAIPEPNAMVLLALGGGVLLRAKSKRRFR